MRFYTLLRRDAWAFTYFDHDSAQAVVDPLSERLQAAGGIIQLGARVTQLERESDGWRVAWTGGEAHAAQVIFALDAPACRALLELSADTAPRASTLIWPLAVATAVMRFWFSRAPHPGAEAGIFTGDFVIDNFFWLDRFQRPFADWHQATGGSAVEVHVYGPPETLAQPDALLLARALLDVQRSWPELRGTMLQQSIRRNPATHSLFSSEGDQIGVATPWPGIAACGDWVEYPHPALYLERAVVTGIAAANRVLAENHLDAWPIRAVDPPEPLARAISGDLDGDSPPHAKDKAAR